MNEQESTYSAKPKSTLLLIFALLTVLGAALAVFLLVRTLSGTHGLLDIMMAAVYLAAYLGIVIYGLFAYKMKGNAYFSCVVYLYAALLGIQILQYGAFISGAELGEGLALLVNIFNLIAFANVIKFSDKLSDKKTALGYLCVAVLLKLAAELMLIIKMAAIVDLPILAMSLSVPILGATLLFAYLLRCRRNGI